MVAAWLAREMVLVVAGANAEIVDAPKRMVVAVSKFMVICGSCSSRGGGTNDDNRVDVKLQDRVKMGIARTTVSLLLRFDILHI